MIASGPGKQLDSLEERETELSMSWVSSAVTCTAKFRMHQQVALPWALAIFWEAFLRGFRDPAQCDTLPTAGSDGGDPGSLRE